MKQSDVVNGVKTQAEWWLDQRLQKVAAANHDSMEVNPFMAPLVSALHGHGDFEELAEFLLGGHFAIGHATGFGKLVDEKILPRVFGTKKLDAAARKDPILKLHPFDNIDHIVTKQSEVVLLSQKASKWTIQLGQAVELNKSFEALIELRSQGRIQFNRIVVGTFYGRASELTDKYRILRGINTGKVHDVNDISKHVSILAGKEFWSWIGDSDQTQNWVMQGIIAAILAKKDALKGATESMRDFRKSFAKQYESTMTESGTVDWIKFLKIVND